MSDAPTLVSTADLAGVLGLSRQAVNRLAREGVLMKAARSRFDLADSVQRYIDHAKDGAKASRTVEAARLQDARAREVEMRIAREDRRLIEMTEAEAATDRVCGLFIETLGGLPARIARDPQDRRRVETIVDEARSRLSERFGEVEAELQRREGSAHDA